jgi:hypothetical protein
MFSAKAVDPTVEKIHDTVLLIKRLAYSTRYPPESREYFVNKWQIRDFPLVFFKNIC